MAHALHVGRINETLISQQAHRERVIRYLRWRMTMKLHATREALDANDADLSGSVFCNVNLSGVSFHDTNMADLSIRDASLSGTRISNANLSGVQISDCNLDGMMIDGVPLADMIRAYQSSQKG